MTNPHPPYFPDYRMFLNLKKCPSGNKFGSNEEFTQTIAYLENLDKYYYLGHVKNWMKLLDEARLR